MTTQALFRRTSVLAVLTLIASAALPAASFASSTTINGAGATFPYPLYSKWFSEYQKQFPDVRINYQSIGSGGGISQFQKKTVDFGATDSPMTDEQLKKSTEAVVHIPTALGAVVLTYNLPDVKQALKLTPEAIADIYLGKITQWNDEAIAKSNPGVKLPDQAIFVVYRSDGSGTTGIFTDYLSKVSPAWKEKVGAGTAVNWPVGLGGKGNEGVTGQIKQTPGALGYVELIYAHNNQLPYAWVKNKAGKFIEPSTKSVTAAAAGASKQMPDDFRVSITHADGADAYPISSFTYLLVPQDMTSLGEKGPKMTGFLKWAMKDGQKYAESLTYAPLPAPVVKKVEAKIASLKTTR